MKRILLEENNRKGFFNNKSLSSPRAIKFIFLGLICFLVVFSAEIWIVNRLATYGDKIQKIKEAQSKLELENQLLVNAVAKDSSMVTLEEKAKQLGFDSINQIEYIKVSERLASAK